MDERENRLELVAPDLASLIIRAEERTLRDAILAVCRAATEGMDDPIIRQAMDALEGRKRRDKGLREKLKRLVEDLDEIQWNMREAMETGGLSEDTYLEAFSRARAANALYFALDPDPVNGALEAIYEAYAAMGDLGRIREIVRRTIS